MYQCCSTCVTNNNNKQLSKLEQQLLPTKRMHSFTNLADDDAGDYLRVQESFHPKFSYSQSVDINMTFEFHLNQSEPMI